PRHPLFPYTTLFRSTYVDFASTAETLIDVQEEPFAGPSIMMQYEVMRTARSNGVIVLLDGQGGDETLLGYHRYYAHDFILHHDRSEEHTSELQSREK